MIVFRLFAAASLAFATLGARAWAQEWERNAWPGKVQRLDRDGTVESWAAAGPLIFKQPAADGETASGFRPFWVQRHSAGGDFRAGFFLYPLFSYTRDENTYKWSVFELVRRTNRRADAPPRRTEYEPHGEFEVFPFWFSRDTGNPEMSYRALFPIAGTVKNKLGFERLSWTLFPFYVENEKRGAVTTSTPWPIVRVTRGAAHGWGVWPFFNYVERPGVMRHETYLWPFGYNSTRYPAPDAAPGTPPRRDIGALPFYSRSTGPGYIDENFGWPFFGYTDRTIPNRYHETRYFWPFLLQGRGDDRYLNRWAPFYTHSVIKGYDKTWYGWPFLRRATWTEAERNVAHTRTQFLYFLYRSDTQRSISRPSAAPANLRHVWPLYSSWDNGAGRRQLQVLSPFEVFFPGNEKVRLAWTPLVALYRRDQRSPGESRTSLLWNLVTWERRDAEARREFHLGPLFSVHSGAEEKRVTIGNGLLGFQRGARGTGWRMLWLDFRSKQATTTSASR